MNLNKEQMNAVINGEGPVIVVAGAGSGKTRVLTHRVSYLINDLGISPYNILAITFTNKAANEMKERVATMTDYNKGLWMCTFHSMCVRILRQDVDKLGYDKDFSIYSETETMRVLKRIISELNSSLEPKACRAEISYAKERALSPEQYNSSRVGYEAYAEIYKRYEEELAESNALDFDDLLIKTLRLLLKFPDVLRVYQERFKYILVDEFQDTNKIQYLLIKALGDYHKNIFAVGDEDQSIYGWRGANVGNFKLLEKDFKGTKVYKLEQNYRSTNNILKCANRLIEYNTERIKKNLWSESNDGAIVEYKCLPSDRDEASYIINCIASMKRDGRKFTDFAILVRANSLTRLFEENLNLYGYPYKVYGGFKFYERKEVKDIVAYLRLITNPRDTEAILRVINFPKRGIGNKAVESLLNYCDKEQVSIIDAILGISTNALLTTAVINKLTQFKDLVVKLINNSKSMNLSELIDSVVEEIGLDRVYDINKSDDQDRLANIDELVNSIKEFHKDNANASLSDYLQSVSLMSDTDDIGDGEYITIATIHSAKGLEFPVVFMIGLEEGIFPSTMCMDSADNLEEERRVMYVGVTRAMERLILTSASSRFRFNEVKRLVPSRFVKEMGFEGIDNRRKLREAMHKRDVPRDITGLYLHGQKANIIKPDEHKDLNAFVSGVKVVHNRYGEGIIIEMKGAEVGLIEFDGLGVKEFNLSIAPIKIYGE